MKTSILNTLSVAFGTGLLMVVLPTMTAPAADPPIGTVKTFLILDDFFGIYRLANFTLRGVGTHAVAWVQNNANFYETLRSLRDTTHHLELAAKRIRANPSLLLFGSPETPEELKRADETDLRLKGRARRYDKEDPK